MKTKRVPEAPFFRYRSFYRKAGAQGVYVEEIVTDFNSSGICEDRNQFAVPRLQHRIRIYIDYLQTEIETLAQAFQGSRHVGAEVTVRAAVQHQPRGQLCGPRARASRVNLCRQDR